MYIVTVSPMALGPRSLSYFTKAPLSAGAIVSIPINHKIVPGIVDGITPVELTKMMLKTNAYKLKKIHSVLHPTFPFHPALIETAKNLETETLNSYAAILSTLIPTAIMSTPTPYEYIVEHSPYEIRHEEVWIGAAEYRDQAYEKTIRHAFAKKHSVALFVPTIRLVDWYALRWNAFSKRILTASSASTPKQQRALYDRMRETTEPYVFIGTPGTLGMLSGKERTIIIEDTDSPHYYHATQPSYSHISSIRNFAHATTTHLILGKITPSIFDVGRERTMITLDVRTQKSETPAIVPLRSPDILSPTIKERISSTHGRILILVSKKGFYSFLVCRDCGNFRACESCGKPLTMQQGISKQLTCYRCGTIQSFEAQCPQCKSWNLAGYGLGTERLAELLSPMFPNRPVIVFDESKVATKQARIRLISQYKDAPESIMVGTELILEEPELTADLCIVGSLDNLFSIPDFRINERIYYTLTKFADRGKQPLMIQSRFADHPVFRALTDRHILEFLKNELSERKLADLPPFTTLVRISSRNEPSALREILRPVASMIDEAPTYTTKERNAVMHHVLLSVEKNMWLHEAQLLKQTLLELPREYTVTVDPQSLV
ncbi:MAG: hypothetical protein AAB372_03120 [Patescibacteria group bacterium]